MRESESQWVKISFDVVKTPCTMAAGSSLRPAAGPPAGEVMKAAASAGMAAKE
jgi:hypothetical protein